MYDVLIKNGIVCDGSGAPAYKADVAVKDGLIAAIAPEIEGGAARVIDASGRVVTPGFIDSHSHGDLNVLLGTIAFNQLEQGITTEIAGQCGESPAPSGPRTFRRAKDKTGPENIAAATVIAETPESFVAGIEKMQLGPNMACFIGHGAIREKVMGFSPAEPSEEQLEGMRELVRRAVDCGFLGVTTGLIYPPSVYGKTEELKELALAASERGGMYDSHIRGEGDFLLPAIDEALAIGEYAGCRTEISHFKCEGKANIGNSRTAIEKINASRARGNRVGYDQYPYTACSTSLLSALPPKFLADGPAVFLKNLAADQKLRDEIRWMLENDAVTYDNMLPVSGFDKWLVCDAIDCPQYSGKMISEIAEERGCDPFTAVFDLLCEATDGQVLMAYFTLNEEDLENIIRLPDAKVGTDGYHTFAKPAAGARPSVHPRHTSTFPRFVHIARELTDFPMETLVRRMTGLAADDYGLDGIIGYVREGYHADLCVVDWDNLTETSDYLHPFSPNSGLDFVLVNGRVAVENGCITGERAGRFIRRQKNLGRG